MCPESIAGYIEAITAGALETCFNGCIRILAAASFFPKKVHAILDASEIQSTEACEGCGCVTKEKAPALRLPHGRSWNGYSASRYGLSGIIRFATIEVHDIRMAREVVAQAITNRGDHGRIVSLACDRGFIDGPFLWLNTEDIFFYIPAKSNMDVYRDASSLTGSGVRQVREKKRSVGYGKNKYRVMDRREAVGTLKTEGTSF